MNKENKLTKKQFDHFIDCVRRWARILNLNDWRIDIVMEQSDEKTYASVSTKYESRAAVIVLNENAPQHHVDHAPIDDQTIERFALHETLHILLAGLEYVATSFERGERQWETVEESVVRILDKVLIDNNYGD